jgi:dsRNA-specific ribonuclease
MAQPVVTGERTLSTKVLADVVEALIGGALLAEGLENAAVCTSQFLPEISATILNINSSPGSDISKPPQLPDDYFSGLESFLGHKFRDSHLLKEALTHSSCQNDADTLSYQRLEFVGDAALDMLIISYFTEHAPSLPPGRLHLIKAAMVNAGFLAYLCLKAVVQQDVVDVHLNHESVYEDFTFEERRSSRSVNLCRFMQHQHANIEIALQNCETRFEQMQSDITKCLKYGTYYPWVLLTSLAHEKFVSNIIESLFGAILINNACTIQACQAFAEKLGLLDYLRLIVEEDIDLRHPKKILGEIAGGRTVEYDIGVQEGTEGYFCTVRVSGMEVAKAFNRSSPDEVTIRAAHTAIDLVKG